MDNKISDSDFSISVRSSQPTVTRTFKFASGATVTFSIALPRHDADTILDMHRKSVEAVIDLLRSTITPK